MSAKKTLLLDWTYYPPVGHAVEGFAAAAEFMALNSDLEIHLLLNKRTLTELASASPWISRCHPIDLDEITRDGEAAACLQAIPTEWDYVVFSERIGNNPQSYSPELWKAHLLIEEHVRARFWKGIRGNPGEGAAEPLAYKLNAPFRMHLPEDVRAWAKQFQGQGPVFSVLLAGASWEKIYPSIDWWKLLFRRFTEEFKDVRLLVTGFTHSDAGRTTTHAYSEESLASLFSEVPNAVNCYNVGLWKQAALLEMSDLFIAPHTGFAFLAPCVGTPWLAVSGVRWPDPSYASVPFYNVMPKCPEYPCFIGMKKECCDLLEKNETVLCMDSALDDSIPEFIEGARRLLDKTFDFAEAIRTYEASALQKQVNMDRLYTLRMVKV